MNDRRILAAIVAFSTVACGPGGQTSPTDGGPATSPDVGVDAPSADDVPDLADCIESFVLAPEGEQSHDGRGECVLELEVETEVVFEARSSADQLSLATADPGDESGWIAPRVLPPGTHLLTVRGATEWTVELHTFGNPVAEIARDRSLVWIDSELVDAPDTIGLSRLMTAASDGEPGKLFAYWLRRFATTRHSERAGPLQLLEQIDAEHGQDPEQWNLDALDFTVTAVHNRIDLADAESCGELRVSVASTHPTLQPFHAIFLFEQTPGTDDVSPAGAVHCGGTQRRWASLSALDQQSFRAEARRILDDGIRPEKFLMIETVEFIVSPWEWRQWTPAPNPDPASGPSTVLENPPLFQTVNTPKLNAAGALRDDFIEFVSANAAALDARRLVLPERFRPRSARVNAGVPWVPLVLDERLDADYPDLRRNLEIVGCPACHATDADFIQTRVDRTFSPFYDKELDARAVHLEASHRGEHEAAPFGPLQPSPALPP